LVPCDVIVAGAGPAGTLAATILARAGARVLIVDRSRFPRAKLCGDTLNPGSMRVLGAHIRTAEIEQRALALDGMLLTGPRTVVNGAYPGGLRARALTRRDLDMLLLDQALEAGAQFDEEVVVTAPMRDGSSGRVVGVHLKSRNGCPRDARAALVIAADGRESRLARAVGLARHTATPRRWAIGGYFEDVEGLGNRGEMHVRAGHYIGVAPVPGGLANACLVMPQAAVRQKWSNPAAMLGEALRSDLRLRERFERARLIGPPHVLGPMAVDIRAAGVPGMLLAGDAAGFIDPITGDGLRFALAGASLAAAIAGDVLAGRMDTNRAVVALGARRRQMFAAKWRFNRAIRALVARPAGVAAAGLAAHVLPAAFEAIIRYAGDCPAVARHTTG
jgi:flavin-dependent dehydrogenase